MKILHLADLHANRDWLDWVTSRCADYGLVVLAGDLQDGFGQVGMHDQARAITRWLLMLRTPTVVCSGNHDFWVRTSGVSIDVHAEAGWIKNLRGRGNIIGVDGDTIDFHGLNIVVNGWLQVPRVDGSCDIIVTHAPPSGCACAGGGEEWDNGDPELWPALQAHPPRLVLSGHIHHPTEYACVWPPIDPATTVLVPGCDEQSTVPAHWIIDTATNTAVHSGGESILT